ncbi:MAG: TlpA family protein disulfide reductase [Draconibacterium sp.]
MKVFRIIILLACTLCFQKVFSQKEYYLSDGNKILTSEEYETKKNENLLIFKNINEKYGVLEDKKLVRKTQDSIIYEFSWEFTTDIKDAKKELNKANSLIGKKFPLTTVKTIKGNNLTIQDLQGKPTLVNLWFTNCKPCLEEIPVLNKIRDIYKDQFNFVAITFDKKEKVEKLLQKTPYNFIHIADSKSLTKKLGIKSYPTNIILDKNGVVKSIEDGIPYETGADNKLIMSDGEEFIELLKNHL